MLLFVADGSRPNKATKGVVSKGIEFTASGKITDDFNLDFGLANFEAEDAKGD
ncbi:hypothetical protein [Aliarcobacter butzleri]|uniref:hypothetical protein n=1 Tax=Aliarcobacter butzleri TaxID=28197 RepID=UPI003AFA3139